MLSNKRDRMVYRENCAIDNSAERADETPNFDEDNINYL